MEKAEAGDLVGRCVSLAALLEVSAYPKPGNVHRTRDFPDTRFEHFLAGAVALGPAMRELGLQGFDAASGAIPWEEVEIGGLVLRAVRDSMSWQRGGNVNLGMVLLLSPLAAAGGAALHGDDRVDAVILRNFLERVIRSTTPDDVILVYEAIRLTMTPKTLGEVEDLDVRDADSLEKIRVECLTLLDVFERCADRDSICSEWVSDFSMTFEVGYPYLKGSLEGAKDTNSAIVDTFLHILSKRPDSLIMRKSSREKAEEVSEKAMRILEAGGAGSERSLEMLWELDGELQGAGGDLNPGTTADLVAASIFVVLLEGWRP
ncbi:MAG: triphosphoribosyl-dephospho-CoA synthase [Candidatus Bathyarchaeota archaeon]|nr:MAG: triphosphoribosyl-dephospho-CoA synthase [Candidatus Bathyarchaeota archaeon]